MIHICNQQSLNHVEYINKFRGIKKMLMEFTGTLLVMVTQRLDMVFMVGMDMVMVDMVMGFMVMVDMAMVDMVMTTEMIFIVAIFVGMFLNGAIYLSKVNQLL